jgi:hypothetical protein
MHVPLRQVCVVAVIGVLGLFVAPAPAYAWWDFIEEFSGPRKFQGPDIQLRLFCVMQPQDPAGARPAAAGQPAQAPVTAEKGSEIRTPGPAGMLLGICPKRTDSEKTKVAFDLGVRFMWSNEYKNDPTPDFARGRTIYFNTLEPTVVFPLVDKGIRLEYAFGAGTYWFSSEGFESFNGFFIEPVRANVHVPLSHGYAFIFSVGALVFPAGFDPRAFAGDREHDERIAADVVPVISIAADLTPAARTWARKLGIPW